MQSNRKPWALSNPVEIKAISPVGILQVAQEVKLVLLDCCSLHCSLVGMAVPLLPADPGMERSRTVAMSATSVDPMTITTLGIRDLEIKVGVVMIIEAAVAMIVEEAATDAL